MFDIEKIEPNRLNINFSGKLDSAAMKVAVDELLAKSEGISKGVMLYKIGDFNLPTLGAIGVELAHFPALFRLIRQFDKAAVITNKQWIQSISEIEGALFPGLDIKAFDEGEEDKAELWLAE